jgi:flagellar motility protein MotE (MotC chaperone)
VPKVRLLPIAIAVALLLALTKAERLLSPFVEPVSIPAPAPMPARPMSAMAQTSPQPAAPPPSPTSLPPPAPSPEAVAERAILEALRARRTEIEAREHAARQRETMLAAAERRLMARVEELTALQTRLETLERERAQREEAGLRGLVKLYEGMRPRDAAQIFDELDMPVLVSIVDRMREAKASPVVGAMRPDRARALTAELARVRAERIEQEAAARRPGG